MTAQSLEGTDWRDLTSSEIESFRQQGAVLLRAILPEQWLGKIRDGLEQVRGTPAEMTTVATGENGDGVAIVDQFASLRNAALADFIQNSPAAALAGQLLGSKATRFVFDQMFYKEAGRILPTPWHQDTPYLRFQGCDLARLWITCDPSPKTVTVRVLKGSHLWNVTYRPVIENAEVKQTTSGEGFSYGNDEDYDESLPAIPDVDAHADAFDILTWDVEPGDILAFNGNVIHGAGGTALHPHHRRAFAAVWAGDDVRYRQRPGITIPDLSALHGKEIIDGTLLSEREDIFPSAWKAR